MIYYFRNPKTENLIILDTNTNEILILEAIKQVRFFTEKDLLYPRKNTDIELETEQKWEDDPAVQEYQRKGRQAITPEKIERIKQMKKDGFSATKIATALSISISSVWKQLKK